MATFTVGDTALTAAAFAATIDWGDGTQSSGGVVEGSDGAFTVYGSHLYAHPGQYLLTVNVVSPGDTALGWATAHVGTPTVDLVSQALVLPPYGWGLDYDGEYDGGYGYYSPGILVATFVDPNPKLTAADFVATIDWGDGYTEGADVTGSDGTFWVSADPYYFGYYGDYGGTQNQFLARLQIQNTAGKVLASDDISITVANGTALNYPYNSNDDYLYYGTSPIDPVWFRIVSPDPLPSPPPSPFFSSSGYSFTTILDWGGGSVDPQMLQYGWPWQWQYWTFPGQSAPVLGTWWAYDGFYAEGHEYNSEGVYTQQFSLLLDSWSDVFNTIDYTWSYSTSTTTLASATANVLIADAPLAYDGYSVSALTPTASVALSNVTVAKFLDDDWTGDAGAYTAAIDWGDGTSSVGTVIVEQAATTVAPATFAVQGSHTYLKNGDYTVSVLIQDPGGASLVATLPADSPPPSPPPPAPPFVSVSAQVRGDDPSRALLLPSGEATVDLNQGAVRISQPLDFDASPGTTLGGNPALVYNSATAGGEPILQVTLNPTATPTSATFTVSWQGATLTPVSWTPPDNQNGPSYVLDIPITATVTASGLYNWKLISHVEDADGDTSASTISGQSTIVVNTSSPYGAGWGLQSTSRLVSALNGDLLLIDGAGDAWLFSYDSYNQSYTTPVGEYGTLTGGNASGQYVYTNQYGTQYDYDLNGRLTQIVQLNGWTTLYNYSGGVLSSVTTPDGGTTSLQYSGGLLSSIVEPGGRTVTLEHDGGGNLTEILDAAGYTRVMAYDGQHLLTEDQWDPYDTTFGYSTLGLLDSLTQSPVSYTIVSANSAQLLNNAGQPLSQMIDGVSDTTSYLLDSRGRVLEEIQPDGSSASWQLDSYGNVIAYTDFDDLTTRYDYDDYGNTVWENDQWVYVPPSGDLVWVSYPNSTYESYAYNNANEVTQYIDADGDVTESQYDGEGELTSQTIGYNTPQAAATTYTWSGGLMQTLRDADGNETVYAYAGLLLASQILYNAQHEEQSSDSFAYDAAGNLTLFVDGDGNTTQYQYDNDNNLTQTVDPDGITTSQQYDAAGFEVSSLDGRGVESDFDYDAAGLETLLSTAAESNVSAYNAAGEQTLSVDADGNTTSYAFDSDGNATLIIQGYGTSNASTSSYAYDEDDNMTLQVQGYGTSAASTSSYAYDSDDNLTLIVEGYGTSAASSTLMEYDGDGNLIYMVNGYGSAHPEAVYYEYDHDGNQIAQIVGYGSSNPDDIQSSYDGDGDLTQEIDSDPGTSDFAYDAEGDITEVILGAGTSQAATSHDYYLAFCKPDSQLPKRSNCVHYRQGARSLCR